MMLIEISHASLVILDLRWQLLTEEVRQSTPIPLLSVFLEVLVIVLPIQLAIVFLNGNLFEILWLMLNSELLVVPPNCPLLLLKSCLLSGSQLQVSILKCPLVWPSSSVCDSNHVLKPLREIVS